MDKITILLYCLLMAKLVGETLADITDIKGYVAREKIGLASLEKDQTEIVITVEIRELELEFKRFRLIEEPLNKTCNKNTIENFGICRKLIGLTKIRLDKIRELLDDFQEPHRTKRSINALGKIIKIITGNLDNDDAKRYEKNFNILRQNQKNLSNDTNLNFKLIEKTININANQLKTQMKKINEEIDKLNTMDNEVVHSIDFIELEGKIILVLEQLNDLINRLQMLNIAISEAKSNILNRNLIGPNKLYEIIMNLRKESQTEYELPKFLYDNVIGTKVFVKNKILYMVYEVPLVAKEKFDIYRIHSIPRNLKDQIFTYLSFENELIFIEENYKKIINTNINTFENKCTKQQDDSYICREINPILEYNIPKTSCELGLYFEQNEKNCKVNFVKVDSPIFIETNNGLIGTFPIEEKCVEFRKNEKREVILKGSKMITTGDGSKIFCKHFEIIGKNKVISEEIKILMEKEITPEDPHLKQLNHTKSINKLQEIPNTIHLQEIKPLKDLELNKEEDYSDKFYWVLIIMGLILITNLKNIFKIITKVATLCCGEKTKNNNTKVISERVIVRANQNPLDNLQLDEITLN